MTAQKMYELLREFGRHKIGCKAKEISGYEYNNGDFKCFVYGACTCGFSDALEQSRRTAEREKQTALDELFQ